MGILEALRLRRAKAAEEATAGYWPTLVRSSRGGRLDAKNAEALDTAAAALGKSLADVEQDELLLGELFGLGDLEARAQEVATMRATMLEQAAAAESEAAALAARASERRQEAEQTRRQVGNLASDLSSKKDQRTRLLRDLSSRGYQPAAEELARQQRDAELLQVRERIETLEAQVEDGEQRASRTDPQTAAAIRESLAAPRSELGRLRLRETELIAEND